ncbi:Uncharacterised protein [Escherichia coli]|uniref:Uncharacterized protein n=1 Tax=Escherichia coli TaxID=562 RepID=A0A377BFK6_ECOLX|nr:Uncharacterised protein [Escherichia coli]
MENIALIGIDLGKNSFIFIARIVAGRLFTVKNLPGKVDRIFGDMPRYNHRNGSLWRFSLYGTQLKSWGIPQS